MSTAATSATGLQQRLAEPGTAATIDRLLDRLDVFAFLLEAIDGFLRRGETVADSVADSIAELRQAENGQGDFTQVIGRLTRTAKGATDLAALAESANLQAVADSGVLERLTDPKTLAQINVLLDRLELVSFLVAALDGFLRRGEDVADAVAEGVVELKKAAPKFSDGSLQTLVEDLPKVVRAGTEMLNSGMFDPNVVAALGEIGKIVANAHEEAKASPPERVGLFGLMSSMRDPRVQTAMGNALHLARRYGEHLEQESK